MAKRIIFTHYWVSGFGWENTIYIPSDFVEILEIGYNAKDGYLFLCTNDKGKKQILKDEYRHN